MKKERVIAEENRTYCNKCGHVCDKNWNYCTYCGAPVDHPETYPQTACDQKTKGDAHEQD